MRVSRASQVHQVPQIGLAQIGPVVSITALNTMPTSAELAANQIEPRVLQPEVEDADEPDQREGEQRAPGGRDVEVEDLLGQSLARLDRRVLEASTYTPAAASRPSTVRTSPRRTIAACSEEFRRHSSTTAGKTRMQRVTKTMS